MSSFTDEFFGGPGWSQERARRFHEMNCCVCGEQTLDDGFCGPHLIEALRKIVAEQREMLKRKTISWEMRRMFLQEEQLTDALKEQYARIEDKKAQLKKAIELRRDGDEGRYVYYVQDPLTRLIKIGSAAVPEKRLNNLGLRDLVLLAKHRGGYTLEKMLHERFKSLKRQHPVLRGQEWFVDKPELIRHIADVSE